MVILDNGEVVSEEEEDNDTMPLLEDVSDDEVVTYAAITLVARRALNMHAKEDGDEEQRENIFHTRCHVRDKICSMIIDGGICTNVASTTMVNKLRLPMTNHHCLYKLHWFNDWGEIRVT